MRSFDKGTITELNVQLELAKRGFFVFTPVSEGCNVDLIFIDSFGAPKKVQVKKAKESKCGFSMELRYSINKKRTGKGFYSEKEIDFFATVFNGSLYMVPILDVLGKATVVLRTNTKYKNQNIPLFAEKYLF